MRGQEKSQVILPPQRDGGEGGAWVSASAARDKKGLVSGAPTVNHNDLPPGMNIEDQRVRDIPNMGMSIAGNMPTDGATGDVTNHEMNATSLRDGFDRKRMSPIEDEYTRSHDDSFYDDVGGFVERSNLLDRM